MPKSSKIENPNPTDDLKPKKTKEKPPTEPTETIEKSFFQKQVDEIGFDPNTDFAFYSMHPDEPHGKKTKQPLFWEDEKTGDVHIGVMDLSGDLMTYDAKDSHGLLKIRPISIKRLKKPLGDTKYVSSQTGWGTFPYPTKLIIDSFKENKTVKKLIIVEGYKKAFAIYKKLGVHCIGIPGINQWKGKKDDEIYNLIKDFVIRCNVSELIFLTDADTLEVKYVHGKDLYRRPFSFYSAVKNFKELTKDFDIDCYFTHIKLDYVDKAKGIDDLLNHVGETQFDEIKREILNTSGTRKYFDKLEVSSKSHNAIKEYFAIANPFDAKKFYYKYESVIGLKEFVYNQAHYEYNDETNDLICHKSAAASQFLMIQDTIYIKGAAPTVNGKILENVLIPVSQNAILIMNKMNKQKADRIKAEMEYYHGAYNYPSHLDFEYFRETEDNHGNKMKWYNTYKEITHLPSPGDCKNSIDMIKHIFGKNKIKYHDKEIYEYELGFDYIKLLWEDPRQILPILVLASEERHTGKTTFWDWLRDIFQQNSRKIEGDELNGQFTSYFANALLIVIEEAFFEKAQTIERMKELVTAKRGKMEAKNKDAHEVDMFIKVGISTNKLKNFARVDKDETRFWIRNVPVIEKFNLNIIDDLRNEIPYFLHYIQERPFVTKRESRSWFAEKIIATEELAIVKRESRWNYEITLENALMEYMSQVRKGFIKLCQSDIKDLTPGTAVDRNQVRKIVEDHWKIKPSKYSNYYNKYTLHEPDELNPEGRISISRKSSVTYSFLVCRFFEVDTYLEFIKDSDDLIELEAEQKNANKPTWFSKINNEKKNEYAKIYCPGIDDEKIAEIMMERKIDTFKDLHSIFSNYSPF